MYTLLKAPDCVGIGASGEAAMFSDVFGFVVRNARLAVTVGVVTGAVSAASLLGWLTAPIA